MATDSTSQAMSVDAVLNGPEPLDFLPRGVLLSLVNALIRDRADLLAALVETAKSEGRYSRDQLTHAENTIDDMKTLARTAIEEATR